MTLNILYIHNENKCIGPYMSEFSRKLVNFKEKTCFKRTFAPILVVLSVLHHENDVIPRFYRTCSLKTLKSDNSDDSVETVIIFKILI